MSDIERALAELSDIRAQLATATRFRGYAPELLVGIAMIAALLMAAQYAWPDSLAATDLQHVLVWGALLALSNIAIAMEAITRSRHRHGGMAQAMLGSALRVQLPAGMVCLVIALAICCFAPETAWIVPGIWLMMIGIVAFASQPILPKPIVWAGLWYSLAGAVVIVLAGAQGRLSGWMMGAPLIVGHLMIAWTLKYEGEASDAL